MNLHDGSVAQDFGPVDVLAIVIAVSPNAGMFHFFGQLAVDLPGQVFNG